MKNRGQSVLEYVVMITAVVAAIVAGVVLFGGKNTSSGLGKVLNKASTNVSDASGKVATIVP